jgi:hypothetical protein
MNIFFLPILVAAVRMSFVTGQTPVLSQGTPEAISKYEFEIQNLASNDLWLEDSSTEQLRPFFYNIVGFRYKDQLSSVEWQKLQKSEITLIAVLLHSVDKRIDPSVKTPDHQVFSFPPYEAAYPDEADRRDQAKRDAYDKMIKEKVREQKMFTMQSELKLERMDLITVARHHLNLLFPGELNLPESVKTILSASGLSKDTIDAIDAVRN